MNQEVLQAKKQIVSEIVELSNTNKALVVVEYKGLTVEKMQELRRALRAEKASLSVYKNSLVERAADELGQTALKDILSGPNAFIFSEDPILGPKIVAKYAKRFGDALQIKGAVIEGTYVDANTVKSLAKLPNREGLISMFLSVLQAPVRQFAATVKAIADAK
jgi:large subunit ribosomal protein L10